MTRPAVSIASLHDAPSARARASASFFAQHPGYNVNLDGPIAQEFDNLAYHAGWLFEEGTDTCSRKWESCFGPDIPFACYRAIDNRCPYMFLDRYFGCDWECSDDVPFEVYFHILAAKEKWSTWTIAQKWRLCFGSNYHYFPLDLEMWLSHDHVRNMCLWVGNVQDDDEDNDGVKEMCFEDKEMCFKDKEMCFEDKKICFEDNGMCFGDNHEGNDPCLKDICTLFHDRAEKPPNAFVVEAREVEAYWAKFPHFTLCPEEPAVEEFERLAVTMNWTSCTHDDKFCTAKCEEEWNKFMESIREIYMQEGMESSIGISGSPVRPIGIVL